MSLVTNEALIEKAIEARRYAYAPYSKHRVGAALLCRDGRIFCGANVENAAFPLGDCAEKVALVKAVSEGAKDFLKIAIVTGNRELSGPCGGCRQVLCEFSSDLEIIVSNVDKKFKIFSLKDLLPFSCSSVSLKKGQE